MKNLQVWYYSKYFILNLQFRSNWNKLGHRIPIFSSVYVNIFDSDITIFSLITLESAKAWSTICSRLEYWFVSFPTPLKHTQCFRNGISSFLIAPLCHIPLFRYKLQHRVNILSNSITAIRMYGAWSQPRSISYQIWEFNSNVRTGRILNRTASLYASRPPDWEIAPCQEPPLCGRTRLFVASPQTEIHLGSEAVWSNSISKLRSSDWIATLCMILSLFCLLPRIFMNVSLCSDEVVLSDRDRLRLIFDLIKIVMKTGVEDFHWIVSTGSICFILFINISVYGFHRSSNKRYILMEAPVANWRMRWYTGSVSDLYTFVNVSTVDSSSRQNLHHFFWFSPA